MLKFPSQLASAHDYLTFILLHNGFSSSQQNYFTNPPTRTVNNKTFTFVRGWVQILELAQLSRMIKIININAICYTRLHIKLYKTGMSCELAFMMQPYNQRSAYSGFAQLDEQPCVPTYKTCSLLFLGRFCSNKQSTYLTILSTQIITNK